MSTQVEKYMEWLEHGRMLSANTIKNVRSDLKEVDGDVEELTRQKVEQIIMQDNKRGLSSATVNRKVSSIRGYVQYLIDNGVIEGKNFVTKHMTPRIRNEKTKTISKEKLDELYSEAPRDIKYLLSLMGYSGMRIDEALSVGELHYDNNNVPYVHLTKTKGDRPRDVSLALVKDIDLIKEVLSEGGLQSQRGRRTTNSAYRILVSFFKKQDVNITPHGLRATYSAILMDADVNINVIRSQLGHVAMGELGAITARYVGEATPEQQAKELKEVFGV